MDTNRRKRASHISPAAPAAPAAPSEEPLLAQPRGSRLRESRSWGVAIPVGRFGLRFAATSLLIVMAIVFFAAKNWQETHPAIAFVRAFAEAAMIGGLADWFAVTALFRRPMGLPIPHTAIVARNKDRIAIALASFLHRNFLILGLIARKMRGIDVAGAVGRFLANPGDGGGRLKIGASRMIADVLAALDQERLGGVVKAAAVARIRKINLGPLLGQILQAALREGRHQPLLDSLAQWGAKALDVNAHLIHQIVHDNSGMLVRLTGMDESIASRMVEGLRKLLAEMASEQDHPLRLKIEDSLASLAFDLQHDRKMQDKVARARDALLANAAVGRWLDGLFEQGRAALLKAANDPSTMLAGHLGKLLGQLGEMLGKDEQIRSTANRYARRAVVGMVDAYGEAALRLVSDTIRSWDAGTITHRLEKAVGDDLQYIRINGTLVGGLAGLLIHTLDGAF